MGLSGKLTRGAGLCHQMASTVNRFMLPAARLPAEAMATLIAQAHINVHGVTDLAGHWLGTGMYLGGSMFNHRYARVS
jgi:hypothetical protein